MIFTLNSPPLNQGEQQVLEQIRAAADPPKTLDELQQPPTDNVLGYQRHHGVEKNRDNVAKSAAVAPIDKFGRLALVLLCHKCLRWVMFSIYARFGGVRGSTRRWVSQ